MPVIGDASIIVRAITTGVKKDIEKAFKGLDKAMEKAGQDAGKSFMDGLSEEIDKRSEEIGKSLNDGIMRGLGDKDKEIADLIGRAGEDAGEQFSEGFTDSAFDGLDDLLDELVGAFGDAGDDAGRAFDDAFSDNALDSLDDLIDDLISVFDDAGSEAGDAFGEGFFDATSGIADGLPLWGEIQDSARNAGEASGIAFAEGMASGLDTARTDLENLLNDINIQANAQQGTTGSALSDILKNAAGTALGTDNSLPGGGGGGVGVSPGSASALTEAALAAGELATAAELATKRTDDLDDSVDNLGRTSKTTSHDVDVLGEAVHGAAAAIGGSDDGNGLKSRLDNLFNSNFGRQALAASRAFTVLYATGNLLGPAIAGLVASISTLITSLVSLAGALGPVVGGLAVIPNLISPVIQGFVVASLSLKGVGDALKTSFEVLDAKTPEDAAEAFSKLNEQLAGLPPEARALVAQLTEMRGEFYKLRDAAAAGFFPALTESLKDLTSGLMPTLTKMFRETGLAIGSVVTQITAVVTAAGTLKKIDFLSTFNASLISQFGSVFGSLIGIFTSVVQAAAPMTQAFVDWTDRLTEGWAATLNTKAGMEGLLDFMGTSQSVLTQLGRIFGELWESIKVIGEVSYDSGRSLLTAFENATEKFGDFLNKARVSGELDEFFARSASNTRALGRLFTEIGKQFFSLGNTSAIGDAADALIPAVENFGKIAASLTESGPALSEFAVRISEIFLALTDTAAVDIFINTLSKILEIISAIVNSEFGQWFLRVVGPLIAFHRALAFALMIGQKLWLVLVGSNLALIQMATKLPLATVKLTAFASGVGSSVLALDKFITKQLVAGATAVVQGARAAAAWTTTTVAAAWNSTTSQMIQYFITTAASAVRHAAIATAAWVASAPAQVWDSFAVTAVRYYVYVATQAVRNAAIATAAWVTQTASLASTWIGLRVLAVQEYAKIAVEAARKAAIASAAWFKHAVDVAQPFIIAASVAIGHYARIATSAIYNAGVAAGAWATAVRGTIALYAEQAAAAIANAATTSAAWVASSAASAVGWVTWAAGVVAQFAVVSAEAVAKAARATAAWAASAWAIRGEYARVAVSSAIEFAKVSASAIKNAALASAAWVANNAKIAASAIATGAIQTAAMLNEAGFAGAIAQLGKMAAAWLGLGTATGTATAATVANTAVQEISTAITGLRTTAIGVQSATTGIAAGTTITYGGAVTALAAAETGAIPPTMTLSALIASMSAPVFIITAAILALVAAFALIIVGSGKFTEKLDKMKDAANGFETKASADNLKKLEKAADDARKAMQPKGFWDTFSLGAAEVTSRLTGGKGAIDEYTKAVKEAQEPLDTLAEASRLAASQLGISREAAKEMALTAEVDLSQGAANAALSIMDYYDSTVVLAPSLAELEKNQKTLNSETATAKEKTDAYKASLDLLNGVVQSVTDATISAEEAERDLEAAFAENGGIIALTDANGKLSEAGAENVKAMEKQQKAAADLAKTIYDQEVANGNLAGAQEAANAAYKEAIAPIDRMIEKYGLNKDEVYKLIGAYDKVPPVKETKVNQPGMPEAQSATTIYDQLVRGIPPTAVTHMTAETQAAYDAANALRNHYAALPPIPVKLEPTITNVKINGKRVTYDTYKAWQTSGVLPPGVSMGGLITGPGGPTDDLIPRMLSAGEFVLTAKAVKNLGGPSAVTALHEAANTGKVLAAANPQAISSATQVAVSTARTSSLGGGYNVNIGQIVAPTPEIAARRVVSETRAAAYRMGVGV